MFFSVACAQQKPDNPVKGVESSISKMGDITNVKVVADQASVRSGCSNNNAVLQTSDKGSVFDVVSKVADWYAVKLPNNQIGFVPEQQCKPIVVENKKIPAAPGTANTTPGVPPQTAPGTDPTAQGAKQKTPDEPQTNAGALSAQENEMLRLVNEARSQNKLAPLAADTELANVARIKSQDMIDNNYFSHNSPKYGSPFDMMKEFGVQYVQAGENIAGNQDVQKAHTALMNSPGHRKNILSPDFTHIGVGISKGGSYGNMFTQMFISKPK
jgi:uncharacterized YkwD family protein